MAAIAIAQKKKEPFGEGWIVMGQTVAVAAGAADEYLTKASLGLRKIISAQLTAGVTTSAARCNMVLNAQGTGQAEDSARGDLGIECSVANTINFVVYGIGSRRRTGA